MIFRLWVIVRDVIKMPEGRRYQDPKQKINPSQRTWIIFIAGAGFEPISI